MIFHVHQLRCLLKRQLHRPEQSSSTGQHDKYQIAFFTAISEGNDKTTNSFPFLPMSSLLKELITSARAVSSELADFSRRARSVQAQQQPCGTPISLTFDGYRHASGYGHGYSHFCVHASRYFFFGMYLYYLYRFF